MNPAQKLSPAFFIIIAIGGFGAGLLLQEWRSGAGYAPFAPPYSLPASLLLLAGLLLILALRLKSAIEHKDGKRVNPFHAVRLLAAARASQITGAGFTGFGLGLLILLLGRPVGVSTGVWLPMLFTAACGSALIVTGLIAEGVCRIPPSDASDLDDGDEVADAADASA